MKSASNVLVCSILLLLSCGDDSSENNNSCSSNSNPNPVFTHLLTDFENLGMIYPMGETTGDNFTGHTFLHDAPSKDKIPIYAPIDMGLVQIIDQGVDWSMQFRVSREIDMEFGHITDPNEEFKQYATTEHISLWDCDDEVLLEVQAGDLLGMTSGTQQAHNFDWGVYNSTRFLDHINPERYRKVEKWLNATCPYDYYPPDIRDQYYALFGPQPVTQTLNCRGSRDKRGTIAGVWYDSQEISDLGFTQTTFSPIVFATKMNGSISATLGESDLIHRLDIGQPTYKDPEDVTDEHCYDLSTGWYFYFQLQPDGTLHFDFGENAPCPAEFPSSGYTVYYR